MKKNFCVVMVSAFLVEMIKAMNPGSDVPHPITVPQHYIALVNLVNDLQPEDVDERALLDALAAKNIDILSNRQYCPMNVLSLKEYLRFLINDRFDAEAVNGYKTEKVARFALLERIPKAVAYFYDKMLKENNSLR
ncbi:MAG: hypothetical protein LBB34_01575, partial [Holosporales bacterium]|nr:hypothetical protein [Holosporales bacterium]